MALALALIPVVDSCRYGNGWAPIDGPLQKSFSVHNHPVLPSATDQLAVDASLQVVYLIRNGVNKKIAGVRGTVGSQDGVGNQATFGYGGYYYNDGNVVTDGSAWYLTDTRNGKIRKLTEQSDGSWIVSTFAQYITESLLFSGGHVMAVNNAGQLAKFDSNGAIISETSLSPTLSYLMASGGKLWGIDKGETYNVLYQIDPVTFATTRIAGLTDVEVAALVAAGKPVPVDGPVDNCTFHTTGLISVATDGSLLMGGGGDETVIRKIKDGRVSTLQNDGSWVETQQRNGGFFVGVGGVAGDDPNGYLYVANNDGTGLSGWLKIALVDVPAPGSTLGYLDEFQFQNSVFTVKGWCWDSGMPNGADVSIIVDNNLVAAITANLHRTDSPLQGYFGGNVGWSIDMPNFYGDGIQHTIIAQHNGQNLAGTPNTFTYSTPQSGGNMKNVLVNWVTQNEAVPNAASADHFIVTLTGQPSVNKPLTATSHTFLSIAPGNYTATVACADVSGALLAPAVSGAVTVPTDPTAAIPVTISITLG